MATSTAQGLTLLRDLIKPERRFPREFVKSWFWRPHVHVIDFVSRTGVKFAAEMHLDEIGLSLKVVARDAESLYSIQRALVRLDINRPININERPITLATWSTTTEPSTVAGDVLVNIQRLLTAFASDSFQAEYNSLPSYWWDMRPNFGDLIGPRIVQNLTERPVHNTYGRPGAGSAIVTVGSIIDVVRRSDMHIWGTGLMHSPSPQKVKELSTKSWKIHAVRGQRTRSALQDHLGWQVPNVVGDPGLLFPSVHSANTSNRSDNVSVVAHYSHKSLVTRELVESQECNFVDVERAPEQVADDIASSKLVISTSLHGIILAQAYQVPWVWLRISDRHLAGNDFKFEDFISTLDSTQVAKVSTTVSDVPYLDLQRMALSATVPRAWYSLTRLRNSFPLEAAEHL